MRPMKSEGTCAFCKKTVSGSAMARHLLSCEKRKNASADDSAGENVFLIRASAGPYFVYFEATGTSTLEKVDAFLRILWLECCGHLSAFTIGNVRYLSYHEELEDGETDMSAKLAGVLRPTLAFVHEYDFGTTTRLDMKVIAERNGKVNGIEVLARNSPPDFRCGCGKPAKGICMECGWREEVLLCEECAKKHKCGEDVLLPVVNSPRMGMCGYTGND